MKLSAGVIAATLLVSGCADGSETSPPTPVSAVSAPPVLVVPASNHVTGIYPAHCMRVPGDDLRLPVHSCTPGSVRSDIDPSHLELTVCKPGWSASVRPPTAETDRLKTEAMAAYGVPAAQRRVTELDHLEPEVLGGSSDVTNLWPEVSDEPGKGTHNSKDELEVRMHAAVCQGKVSLQDAQAAFASNWTTVAQALGLDSK